MDGWMDGRTDGWMDGWMDGVMGVSIVMVRQITGCFISIREFEHGMDDWLVVWMNLIRLSIQLGISSSQLTFIFFGCVETTNQMMIWGCLHFAPPYC